MLIIYTPAWALGPLKMQDRPIGFNETDYKHFTDMISPSILQMTFKKLLLLSVVYPRERRSLVT